MGEYSQQGMFKIGNVNIEDVDDAIRSWIRIGEAL